MKIYPPGALIASRYEVASHPMMGGMGIVYICLDRVEDRPVALKTFKPEYLPDRAARDRFLREGTHWVDLGAHLHIVRCYGVERVGDGTEVYLVLELIAKVQGYPDASLRSWLLPGRPLPVETALLFALQIARGMQHATETIPGFVHRDLKPENILVGADRLSGWSVNRLRITDFGLAGVLESFIAASPSETSNEQPVSSNEQPATRTQLTHGIVGTPLYMAPEQWQGEPLGVYTDVYALGCNLYEMLTGQRAAAGNSPAVWQRVHCVGELRPVPPDLPEGVRALVARWLAREPAARPGTWAAVLAGLTEALVALGQSVPAAPAPAARVQGGWSYNAMGYAYLDLGKASVAVGYFERAIAAGEREGVPALRGAALGNLGLAYADLGEVRRATSYYEECLTLHREIGDRRGEGADLGNLGVSYKNLGEVRRAIGYYEEYLRISREIGDRRGEGTALGNLGSAYLQLGEVRRAIGYYEECLTLHREIGDRRGEGNVLGNLGIAYKNLGEVRCAIGYYEECLRISREIGDRRGESTALGNLGIAYAALGDARRAIGYYEQALAIDRETGDRHGEGTDLGNLGGAYHRLGEGRRAIGYYEEYLRISREIGDRRGEGTALGNLGSAYLQLGEVQRAIGYYEQAIAIRREIGDSHGVATDAFNMALLYVQQGDPVRALPLAQESAQIFTRIGSPHAQQAQQLVARLQGGGAGGSGPRPD